MSIAQASLLQFLFQNWVTKFAPAKRNQFALQLLIKIKKKLKIMVELTVQTFIFVVRHDIFQCYIHTWNRSGDVKI